MSRNDITPVGTIGIVVRGFREKKIDREETIRILKNIYDNSSLFITSRSTNHAIDEIKNLNACKTIHFLF